MTQTTQPVNETQVHTHTEMACIQSADIEIEDHGMLIINIVCRYEVGEQSFCPIIQDKVGHQVIKAVLKAVNVYKFSDLPHKFVRCVIVDGLIKGMKPVMEGFGTPFMLNDFDWKGYGTTN